MRHRLVPLIGVVLAAGACASSDDTAAVTQPPPTSAPAVATSDAAPADADDAGQEATADTEPVDGSVPVGDEPPDTSAAASSVAIAPETDPEPPATPGEPAAELEESLAALGVGEGAGAVVIDGGRWDFDAEICDARTGFIAVGPGEGPDGATGFVEIYVDAGVDLDNDGEPDDSASVSVTVGKTELFGEEEPGSPLWLALVQTFAEADRRDFTYAIDDATISGEGEIRMFRGPGAPSDGTVPLLFEASCG